ncbi:hypothetical protein DI110_12280 [Legionella pneumophila]|nr:hypothetical protein DI110_12280 [Legionella pneumophila]
MKYRNLNRMQRVIVIKYLLLTNDLLKSVLIIHTSVKNGFKRIKVNSWTQNNKYILKSIPSSQFF